MGSGWANARQLARLRRVVVQLYGAVCYLCHRPIDLALVHPDPRSLSLHHVRAQASTRHLTAAQQREPRRLRPTHLVCNQRLLDRPDPTRRPWRHPQLNGPHAGAVDRRAVFPVGVLAGRHLLILSLRTPGKNGAQRFDLNYFWSRRSHFSGKLCLAGGAHSFLEKSFGAA